MKASIYQLWWNPWGEEGLDFNKNVSISVDNLQNNFDADLKILFLAEPYSIAPTVNEGALNSSIFFDKIYTFNQAILNEYPQAELFPWGSSWLDFDNLNIEKQDVITFVTSNKSQTLGHKLRLDIFDYLNPIDEINGMEIFSHMSPPFHQIRNDFFYNAKFHICVENSIQKNYFTEKIIDCFASKTIPIYFGCPNLGDWFNMNGVYQFENLKELNDILDLLSPDVYEKKIKAIEENYEIAKQFYGENDVVPRLTKKITEFVNHAI
jgi:hypothetical protein